MKARALVLLFLFFISSFLFPIPLANAATSALTQTYSTTTPLFFNNKVVSTTNETATYKFRALGIVRWQTFNTSNINSGNLSLVTPLVTTLVNFNDSAFWYSESGLIGLSTVTVFFYFFK